MLARTMLVAALIVVADGAGAQEREWRFETGEAEAFLSFGVPETDDIGLSFWCTLHSGEIKLYVPETGSSLKPGTTAKLRMKAGTKNVTYEAKTLPNEESGGVSAEAALSSNDQILVALLTADRFNVAIDGENWNFPLENADIKALLRACNRT